MVGIARVQLEPVLQGGQVIKDFRPVGVVGEQVHEPRQLVLLADLRSALQWSAVSTWGHEPPDPHDRWLRFADRVTVAVG